MAKAPPSLLEHAISALTGIHEVQVGLARAGADPKIVQTIGQCAQIMTQVVHALGQGPALDNASGGGQPAGQPPTAPSASAGPPAGAPPGPPQAAPAQAPPSGNGHGGPMLAAAKVLQAAHAAANAK